MLTHLKCPVRFCSKVDQIHQPKEDKFSAVVHSPLGSGEELGMGRKQVVRLLALQPLIAPVRQSPKAKPSECAHTPGGSLDDGLPGQQRGPTESV
jgi:hypothetical protein